jgi:hypothetical protein
MAAERIVAAEDAALGARVAAIHPLASVSAGSALLRIADRLLAVHDDAFRATWIDLPSLKLTPLLLAGDGMPLPKATKPDFEAAVRAPDGSVHLLGSGATPNRRAVARIDPRTGSIGVTPRPELYRCIQESLPGGAAPNIEGAVFAADRLVLFHRGIGTPSVIVDLPLDVLEGGAPRVLRTVAVELGTLAGIPLSFTDAAVIDARRIAFAATAEDAPDAIADGPVAGSVIGVLEDHNVARWTGLEGPDGALFRAKVEGLVLDAAGAWVLTDADDPGEPALLGRVVLRGFD